MFWVVVIIIVAIVIIGKYYESKKKEEASSYNIEVKQNSVVDEMDAKVDKKYNELISQGYEPNKTYMLLSL